MDFENWKKSSFANKVGTLLWGLSALLLLVGWICAMASDGEAGKIFMLSYLPFFIIGALMTFFLLRDVDVVKAIAKNVGYYMIFCIVMVVISVCVCLPIIGKILEPIGPLASALESLVEAIGPSVILDALGSAFSASPVVFIPFLVLIISPILVIIGTFLLSPSDRPKNRLCALVMLGLFGICGGHLSYVKRRGAVVARVIFLVTIILLPLSALLCLFDLIKILTGRFKDGQGNFVTDWV